MCLVEDCLCWLLSLREKHRLNPWADRGLSFSAKGRPRKFAHAICDKKRSSHPAAVNLQLLLGGFPLQQEIRNQLGCQLLTIGVEVIKAADTAVNNFS